MVPTGMLPRSSIHLERVTVCPFVKIGAMASPETRIGYWQRIFAGPISPRRSTTVGGPKRQTSTSAAMARARSVRIFLAIFIAPIISRRLFAFMNRSSKTRDNAMYGSLFDWIFHFTPWRVKIKLSTLWGSGVYKFQQLRNQNYEFLICIGISPLDAQAWIFRKDRIPFRTLPHQHAGARGSDTWWISLKPSKPPLWMNRGQRGRLRDVYRIIGGLRSSK